MPETEKPITSEKISEQQAREPEQNSGYLFYNVMPKNFKSEKIIQPDVLLTSTPASEPNPALAPKNFLKKNIRWAIILFGLIALSALAYFIFASFIKQKYPEENLLVPQETQNTSTKDLKSKPTNESVVGLISKEWQKKYFNSELCQEKLVCGDKADPDRDGLENLVEFRLNTDPNNPDSDQDGIADGDEVKIFLTNPLKTKTNANSDYTDADYAKGGYNISTDQQLSQTQIFEINKKIIEYGIHKPTTSTLGDSLLKIYQYTETTSPTSTPESNAATTSPTSTEILDQSIEAKQDRDAQRTNTIKNLGIALVKYFNDNDIFPETSDFSVMHSEIKLYLKVATNPVDPINKPPYVYAYSTDQNGQDFVLSFFSETANQLIKKRSADAKKDMEIQAFESYDNQRKTDLDNIRTAILLYSASNSTESQEFVFPPQNLYKSAIMPKYISELPKDPKTLQDYLYEVSETFSTFTLKTILENAPTGLSGYLCNQEECRYY